MDVEGVSTEHTQKQQNTKPRGQSVRELVSTGRITGWEDRKEGEI